MSLAILDIGFDGPYTTSVEFKTNIVSRFDGGEQRKPLQFYPIRTFTLPLYLTPAKKERIREFFTSLKGAYAKFLWHWDEAIGGNGCTYECYFCDDALEESVLHYGYSQINLKFCTIETSNVLKNSGFISCDGWECLYTNITGNMPEVQVFHTGGTQPGMIRQRSLIQGKPYRLEIKCQLEQGELVLSADTSDAPAQERYIYSGESVKCFTAVSDFFRLTPNKSSIATIQKIAVYKEFKDADALRSPALIEHSYATRFLTIKDPLLTPHTSRIAAYDKPLRRWVLSFQKNPADFCKLEEFFIAQKGSQQAFNWIWDVDHGGDGATYRVRFDSDSFEAKRDHYGYGSVQIPIIEVRA